MRIRQFAWALFLFPVSVLGQENFTVKGRIVNEQGEAVEYVQVGIPRLQTGTISSADGRFEMTAPRDTIEFFHVSYETGRYAVTGPAEDVVIVLRENELPPAVFIGGNAREKSLVRHGTKIFGDKGLVEFSAGSGGAKGAEIGSVAKTKKPFLVRDIEFRICRNTIPGCVVSVNIYRIGGNDEEFVNVLRTPIYVSVAESSRPRSYHVQPDGNILLEPGKYFIAFQIVGCDEDALRQFLADPESGQGNSEMRLSANVYLKSSYIRNAALGKMKPLPVNIGMVVRGLEYQ